jgi:ribosomal protein S18 acetylase RimI-like enzyme
VLSVLPPDSPRQQNSESVRRTLYQRRPVNSIKVRSYVPADHHSLVRIWSRAFPDDPPRNAPEAMIRNKKRVQPELLLVATLEDDVVGAVMAGFDGTRGWIYHLAVDIQYRRKGVGTALVRAAEDGLLRLGCPKVNLQVRAGNQEVVAFYESLGYEVEPRVSLGKILAESF